MLTLALSLLTLLAQSGDKKGELQPPLPPHIKVPPAPVLTPEEAIKTLQVAPGFRIELVASEPLVFEPVAMAFDADGRARPDWAEAFLRRPLAAAKLRTNDAAAHDWPALVDRLTPLLGERRPHRHALGVRAPPSRRARGRRVSVHRWRTGHRHRHRGAQLSATAQLV